MKLTLSTVALTLHSNSILLPATHASPWSGEDGKYMLVAEDRKLLKVEAVACLPSLTYNWSVIEILLLRWLTHTHPTILQNGFTQGNKVYIWPLFWWIPILITLSTKFGSTTFCFSFSSGPSMVTKKTLMPDSLASREASSTLSVGHPSTSTMATLGAPPLFPLESSKKCLLTKESAFPRRDMKRKKQEELLSMEMLHPKKKLFSTDILHNLLCLKNGRICNLET